MNPGEYDQPSPIIPPWVFVADVSPSTDCESYDSATGGALPVTDDGTVMG
jgi:hypothetical protein